MNEEFEKIPQKDLKVQKVERVVHEVLGDIYFNFAKQHLALDENFDLNKAKVTANLLQIVGDQQAPVLVEGEGVGLVDAFFDGMLKTFAREYSSLSSISIVDFQINIKFKNNSGRKSDALAVGSLTVKNSEDFAYVFSSATPSVSRTSIGVVLEAVRFFINSERAYVQLYIALEDAKKRGRFDLIERYQNQMSILVQATSYREIVERLSFSKLDK